MTAKDLYNVIPLIDEKFLEKREDSIKTANENKQSLRVIKVAVCLAVCLCLFAVIFIIQNNGVVITPDVTTNPNQTNVIESTTEDSFESHGGEGSSSDAYISSAEVVPKELLINADIIGPVKYLSEYITPFEQDSLESKTPEREEKRIAALNNLLSLTGVTDYTVEYDFQERFPVAITPDAKIIGFTSYFGIESDDFINLTMAATDEDIGRFFVENIYTNALMQFIGLDVDNLYVYRDITSFYDEFSDNTITTVYFSVTNYSESPQQLALNLQSNYIKFWITENYNDNAVTISSVYGYYVPENSENELTDYKSYDEALEIAMQAVENLTADKVTSSTIIYVPDYETHCLMPYYRFYYKINDEHHNICISLAEGKTFYS